MGMKGIHVAAALACATAVLAGCAAAPAHALELYDLSAYAEYYPDTGTIHLTPFSFAPNPGVDWSSVDPGKMRLVGCAADGGCAEVPMSVRVVVDVFFGGNLLELSPDGGPDVLAGAASLTLTIEEGAYRKADGGAANVPLSVPVVMPGEYPAHLLEGAAYDHLTDQLSLFFADAVDASSVDWDRIYLYGQPLIGRLGFDVVPELALVPMPEPDLVVGSREDGRVAGLCARRRRQERPAVRGIPGPVCLHWSLQGRRRDGGRTSASRQSKCMRTPTGRGLPGWYPPNTW